MIDTSRTLPFALIRCVNLGVVDSWQVKLGPLGGVTGSEFLHS